MSQPVQYKIVILEEDQVRRDYLKSMVSSWGYVPYSFEKETICLDNLSVLAPDMAICGSAALKKMFRFVASMRLVSRKLPLLILSSSDAVRDYIHTNGFGPVLMLAENGPPSEIRKIISKNINCSNADEATSELPLIIGNSPEIIKIKKMIPELSCSRETTFIRGEAGTGKELIAKSIFLGSDREKKSFVKVNGAAISPAADAREIFGIGHEPFSAEARSGRRLRTGVNTGTIFFDRVESLPAEFQVGLLQILKEGEREAIEDGMERTGDIRIIASAGTELEPLVESGRFRKDLYHRLNVLRVSVPPLRRRKEDIPLLADFFADKFCLILGRSCFEMSSTLKTILCRYHWPGNVGELENMIRGMVVSGHENKIIEKLGDYSQKDDRRDIADFFKAIIPADVLELHRYVKDSGKVSMKEIWRMYKTKTEGRLIKQALDFNDWNRKKTARMLSISYKSLLNKIRAYGLKKD